MADLPIKRKENLPASPTPVDDMRKALKKVQKPDGYEGARLSIQAGPYAITTPIPFGKGVLKEVKAKSITVLDFMGVKIGIDVR